MTRQAPASPTMPGQGPSDVLGGRIPRRTPAKRTVYPENLLGVLCKRSLLPHLPQNRSTRNVQREAQGRVRAATVRQIHDFPVVSSSAWRWLHLERPP